MKKSVAFLQRGVMVIPLPAATLPTMKDTIRPFSLGSNIMIEISNGIVRQLKSETLELIREIPVSALNDQQIAAMEKRRAECAAAAVAQGFQKPGYVNEK